MRFPLKINFLLLLAWTVLITVLLTLPGSALPKEGWLDFLHPDKWIHLVIFAVLVWLTDRVIKKQEWPGGHPPNMGLIQAVCFLYGAGMEVVQHYLIPNRSFDVWDIVADGAGCLVGYWMTKRKTEPVEKSKPL